MFTWRGPESCQNAGYRVVMQGCFHKCENISNDDERVAYLASFLTSLLSLCYDNTNPFRTRKNSSRRQMRLICNNPRPRRAHAVPPKHGREEQRLLARIRNMLIRSKRKDAENGRGAAAFGPTIYRSQRHHSTRMSDEGMQEFPVRDFFL